MQQITHINSSMSAEYLAYMLRFDSTHGRFPGSVEARDGVLYVNNKPIYLSSSRDPSKIDWKSSNTDFVCESTGAFCTLKDASQHVDRYLSFIIIIILYIFIFIFIVCLCLMLKGKENALE